MSNIFVDLGAYNGDTVKEFLNWGGLVGDPNGFTIYAFEPNPNVHDGVKLLAKQKDNVIFSGMAAWILNGEVEFAVDESKSSPMGSTLESSKENIWNNSRHITVKCFDFSEWIKQFESSYVIVKMDIEGAEFEVLEKMLKDDTAKIMDKLMCEFHPNKVKNYTTDDKNCLIKRLKQHTEVIEWH